MNQFYVTCYRGYSKVIGQIEFCKFFEQIGSNLHRRKIEQIEMVFSFSKGEELSSFKTVYVPVHILETPTPINPDKTDKTETVKNDTNNKTTVKQTSSTAVKTGDNTAITAFAVMMFISGCVFVLARRKRND